MVDEECPETDATGVVTGEVELEDPAETAGLMATMTSVGWSLADDVPLGRWRAAGRMIGGLGRRIPWAIGDWLNFGERVYGETYAQFADETGYDEQTLQIYRYVAD